MAVGALAVATVLMAGNYSRVWAGPPQQFFDANFWGYILTSQGGNSTHLDVKGTAIINADSSGNLSGGIDFFLVDPSLPSSPASETGCSGPVTGNIGALSDPGYAVVTLNYTPGAGAPAGCAKSTTILRCTHWAKNQGSESDPSLGHYVCTAQQVNLPGNPATVDAVSMRMYLNGHSDTDD